MALRKDDESIVYEGDEGVASFRPTDIVSILAKIDDRVLDEVEDQLDDERFAGLFATPAELALATAFLGLLKKVNQEPENLTEPEWDSFVYIQQLLSAEYARQFEEMAGYVLAAKQTSIRAVSAEHNPNWSTQAVDALLFDAVDEIIQGDLLDVGQRIGMWRYHVTEDGQRGFFGEAVNHETETSISFLVIQKEDKTLDVILSLDGEPAIKVNAADSNDFAQDPETEIEETDDTIEEDGEEASKEKFLMHSVELGMSTLAMDLIDFLSGKEVEDFSV